MAVTYSVQGRVVLPGKDLIARTREELRKRRYSTGTEEAYIGWIRRFIRFHQYRHPSELGETEVEAFLSHRAVDGEVAAATQNQALAGLLFLSIDVMGMKLDWLDGVVRAKKPKRLPVVMTRDEVKRLAGHLHGPVWIAAVLMYGTGLRLLECLRLRVKDIDFGYRPITVREGKGKRDRVTVLPDAVIEPPTALSSAGNPPVEGGRTRKTIPRPSMTAVPA
ncbi:MAG: phage integrase N-terminal SAM-like domain-containing protein [Deltaproteobacteria bacterium]|nr:phage integrase N-terminal SAM-like domain-containing protein [Deltaproteobacteria bacterium]